ncbi:MAG: hypothetical protein LC632_00980 [Xanthomonadaceae bacterium]|nr:hypothetical protein [Xanthomonadaceae bacterium]
MAPLADRVTVNLTPLEIAERQIDRAITLFLDDADYISASTLAGAAEGIIGDLLRRGGRPYALDDIVKGAMALTKEMDPSDSSKRKDYIAFVNDFRDRLKHLKSGETLHCSVDYEAACLIDRAMDNYFNLTESETETMLRFRRFNYFEIETGQPKQCIGAAAEPAPIKEKLPSEMLREK